MSELTSFQYMALITHHSQEQKQNYNIWVSVKCTQPVYYLNKQQKELPSGGWKCLQLRSAPFFLFVFIIILAPLIYYESCFQSMSAVHVIKNMFNIVSHWFSFSERELWSLPSLSVKDISTDKVKCVWLTETLLLGSSFFHEAKKIATKIFILLNI